MLGFALIVEERLKVAFGALNLLSDELGAEFDLLLALIAETLHH